MTLVGGVVVVVAVRSARVGQGFPGDVPPADPRLDAMLDAVDFDRTPLVDALAELSRRSGLSFVIQPQSEIDPFRDAPITLHLRQVRVAPAMEHALRSANPDADRPWAEAGGTVTIGRNDDDGPAIVRVYDVRALLANIRRFRDDDYPPPVVFHDFSSGPTASIGAAEEWEIDPKFRLSQIVQEGVRPNSWKDNGGAIGSMSIFGGQLVVVQSAAGQREVDQFLRRVGG